MVQGSGPPIPDRRRGRAARCVLAVVVGGSVVAGAAPAQAAAFAAPVATATFASGGSGTGVAGSVRAAVGPIALARRAADEQAGLFIARSQCPVAYRGARSAGRVTRANRRATIDQVVRQSLVATAEDGVCTAVGRPGKLSAKTWARYRSVVAKRVSPGDVVLRESWRLPNSRVVSGLAVFRADGRLRLDPLISTYAMPAPPLVVDASVSSSVALREGMSSYQEYKWDPVVNGGLVENIWGSDVVTKTVRMRLYVTDGLITDSTEVATASGSTFVNATISKRVETVSRGGCECKKFTVTVKWASVLTNATGTDVEVFTLCSNGLSDYVQSN